MSTSVSGEARAAPRGADVTTFSIIMALSFSHFLNDMMQSLVPAIYPMLKGSYGLSFAQIGLITLTMQVASSVLQPAIGLFADHRPQPYSPAPGRRCFTRKPRGSHGWHRAAGTAWRSPCFRSAAMPGRRSARSWRR